MQPNYIGNVTAALAMRHGNNDTGYPLHKLREGIGIHMKTREISYSFIEGPLKIRHYETHDCMINQDVWFNREEVCNFSIVDMMVEQMFVYVERLFYSANG